jgi:hypothetical protein
MQQKIHKSGADVSVTDIIFAHVPFQTILHAGESCMRRTMDVTDAVN